MVATTGIFSRLLHTPQIVSGGSIRTSSNSVKIKFGHDEEQFTQGQVPCHAKQWPTPPSFTRILLLLLAYFTFAWQLLAAYFTRILLLLLAYFTFAWQLLAAYFTRVLLLLLAYFTFAWQLLAAYCIVLTVGSVVCHKR